MKYLKEFNTHNNYLDYKNGSIFAELKSDSVSYCKLQKDVHFDKYILETKLVCKYNVTDTSNSIQLISGFESNIFNSMEIDGNLLNELVTHYTFETEGIHTVKYELYDNTKIGNSAPVFYSSDLIEATIPDGVTNICDNSFVSCSRLTNVSIPNSVINIGNNAFSGCVYLETITIPNNITIIGDKAFQGCGNITSITINAITPPALGTYTFANTNNCPIYVPAESVETYKAAIGWGEYADRIQAISE